MRVFTTILLTFFSLFAFSQEYKFEVGVGGGVSSYQGDHYEGFPFGEASYSGNLLFRYNIDFRQVIRAEIGYTNLRISQGGTALYEVCGLYEYNFFHFGNSCQFLETRPYTAYVGIGLGASMPNWSPELRHGNRANAMQIVPIVPLSFGFKFKLTENLNLGAEWSVRWYLSDELDGPLEMRPSFNIKGNDWYNLVRLYLTFDFGSRLNPCRLYYPDYPYKSKRR